MIDIVANPMMDVVDCRPCPTMDERAEDAVEEQVDEHVVDMVDRVPVTGFIIELYGLFSIIP